jgi:hypothetical protein
MRTCTPRLLPAVRFAGRAAGVLDTIEPAIDPLPAGAEISPPDRVKGFASRGFTVSGIAARDREVFYVAALLGFEPRKRLRLTRSVV